MKYFKTGLIVFVCFIALMISGCNSQEEPEEEKDSTQENTSQSSGNAITISDENFNMCLRQLVEPLRPQDGLALDEPITEELAAEVTEINCAYSTLNSVVARQIAAEVGKITNTNGLEHFVNLKTLDFSGHQLTSASLDSLTQLTSLALSNNQITSIGVSLLSELISLDLSNNQISEIEVNSLTQLTSLALSNNQISSIDLSSLNDLTSLALSNNQISSIDLSRQYTLQKLELWNNNLTNINLSNLTNLKSLNLSNNQLTSIDNLSSLSKLTELQLWSNQLSSIDLANLSKLSSLNLSNNSLSSITNLDGLTSLQSINLSNNKFISINFSGLTNITHLNISNNQLTSISGLGKLSKLQLFFASGNSNLDCDGLNLSDDLINSGNCDNLTIIGDLTQASYPDTSSTFTQFDYEGLKTYHVPTGMVSSNTPGSSFTTGYSSQFNPSANTSKITSLAGNTYLGVANNGYENDVVELSFTAVQDAKYFIRIKDGVGDSVATANYTMEAGKNRAALATTNLNSELEKSIQFTANSTAMKIWFNGMDSNYSVEVIPANDFGDAILIQKATLTLKDNIPPMINIQDSTADLTSAGTAGISSTTSSIAYPLFDLNARYYVNGTRDNSTTYLDRPLLGNQNSSTYATYSSGRTDQYYTAKDYAQWNSNATPARSFSLDMTEALASLTATISIRNNSNTSSTLADTTNGITSVSVSSNGNTHTLTLGLGDWRTITNNSFLDISGIQDSAGNDAGTTTGIKFIDKTPPLAIAMTASGAVLSIAFDQPIAALASTNYSTSTATTVMHIIGQAYYSGGMFNNIATTVSYDVYVQTTGDVTVDRNLIYQDPYGNSLASGANQQADVSLSTTNNQSTLTITVSDTTVSGTSYTDTNVNMGAYFSPLQFSQSGSVGFPDVYASFATLKDENGNTWGGIIGSANAYVAPSAIASSNILLVPLIIASDATPPKIASTGIVQRTSSSNLGFSASNSLIDLGGNGSSAILAIAHTGISVGTGDPDNNSYRINGTSGTGHIASSDNVWSIGDSNDSSTTEIYKILVMFNEAIVCNSCTLTASNTTKYETSSPTPVNSRNNTSTTLLGSSSNTLLLTFQLNASQIADSADSIIVSGVEDTSGNTTTDFTIKLSTTAGSGIIVTPTSAVY
ncbi:MAG: leucine-rich repeat domain-containing protein [SAR324 cluster bacterium]|nr:leucine-rich repeat domain-containing protein [SAR324 cluster bacterium]